MGIVRGVANESTTADLSTPFLSDSVRSDGE
jgi:hypothetical protein